MTQDLRIGALLANAPVDPKAHFDAARVQHYAEILETLPPVVDFETKEGYSLLTGIIV
jgi:hypothetical protein